MSAGVRARESSGRAARARRTGRAGEAAYHHGDLRAAMVQEALRAVEKDGELPPLRALADHCGVSHAALYRHFDNVEALRLAVAAHGFRQMAKEIETAIAVHPEPYRRLSAGNRAAIWFAVRHRALYGLMLGPELAGKQHHQEFLEAAAAVFGTLARAVAHCGVPNPVPVAHTVLAAVHGLGDMLRNGRTIPGGGRPLEDQIGAMCTMTSEYVRTQVRLQGSV